MPEKGVVCLFHREIGWEQKQLSKAADSDGPGSIGHGDFLAHSACCARVSGQRQTFNMHVASPTDPLFIPMPVARPRAPLKKAESAKQKKEDFFCKACHSPPPEEEHFLGSSSLNLVDQQLNPSSITPTAGAQAEVLQPSASNASNYSLSDSTPEFLDTSAADYINNLHIRGQIYSQFRGKELVFAIASEGAGETYIFRIGFGLEAPCFWMPTTMYRAIVSQPDVQRGEKSRAYQIPPEFCKGPPGAPSLISIQAAFIRPNWTLVFCDHNVMITFHVMRLRPNFRPEFLQPGSQLWPALWSKTHGPVYCHEPDTTVKVLNEWRRRMIEANVTTPIFFIMKASQDVFNGTGAQEATDQLQLALISPLMPTKQVCCSDIIWARFFKVVIEYEATRLALASEGSHLPHLSSSNPVKFNKDGHKRYMKHISTYRRAVVRFSGQLVQEAEALGLFNPNATVQANGFAVEDGQQSIFRSDHHPATVNTSLRTDRNQQSRRITNYVVAIEGQVLYTPFIAKGGADWPKILSWSPVDTDVKDVANKTTLGLYSFRLFVDQVWSVQRTQGIPLPSRQVFLASNGRCKRPLAKDIARTGAPMKKRKVNMLKGDEENFDISEGRITRSMRRK
ncbi:hypothetical protein B0H12DRAFT_1142729 [Mycena haematopus]|nr:hypothetical protein B0H12DRAFT_1142729 [Mycena haematopus]